MVKVDKAMPVVIDLNIDVASVDPQKLAHVIKAMTEIITEVKPSLMVGSVQPVLVNVPGFEPIAQEYSISCSPPDSRYPREVTGVVLFRKS